MPVISRRTRNWVLLLVLVPAVAYGVAKVAIWYTVRDGMENLRHSLAPVATMEYSRVLSSVFGPFGATGIRISPHVFDAEITIGSALIHIENPLEKFEFLNTAMKKRIPTTFNFSLNNIRVPLTGEVGAWLDSNMSTGGSTSQVCDTETGTSFSAADMKEMGYEDLVGNVVLDYAYDRRGGGLATYLKVTLRDMFEVTLEGTIPASEVVFTFDRVKGVPKFSDASVTLNDLSWSSRFNQFCANKLGITEQAYVQKRLDASRKSFEESGFRPSAELMAALEKFATGKAPLTLNVNPRDPIELTGIDTDEDPEYLIDKLGLEVLVDGNPVKTLGSASKEQVAETEEASQPVAETYKPTPVAELPQYIKSQVRVFTTDGNVQRGYLDSVDAEKIVLTREMVGGSATFDIGRADIRNVLVLRR